MFARLNFGKLVFPNTITTIEPNGYVYSRELELNEGLTTIGNYSIYNYEDYNYLKYINIPSTLINNGNYIKINCPNDGSKYIVKGGNNLTAAPIVTTNYPNNYYPYIKNAYIDSTNIRLVVAQHPYPHSYNRFTVGGDAGLPTTVTAPSGGYFEDGSNTQDIILNKVRDNVYEIANVVYKATVIINTNMSSQDPDFLITYTNHSDEEVQTTVKAGTHILPIKYGTTVKVSAVTEIDGMMPSQTEYTWNYNSTSCSKTFTIDYVERTDVYIQHIDGTLYTTDQWTSGGYANEDANGVAIVRPISGSFVIAKTDVSSGLAWGGFEKTITDIVTSTSKSTAVLDNDGAGNTPKIIEQCSGYTSSGVTGAPAAEGCANYTFPNGKTGYLGALGEWKAARDNDTKVDSAMSLIGGTAINNSYYWTSTQGNDWNSWKNNLDYGGKSYTYYVRAFCPLS